MFKRFLAAVAIVVPTATAHAAWMGLDDGTYALTLTCTTSPIVTCPATFQGTLTINGRAASFMDVTVEGIRFTGDPLDSYDGPLEATQSASLFATPKIFDLFLILPTSTSGPVQFWNYVPFTGAQLSAGTWAAVPVPVSNIPLPGSLVLLAGGIGIFGLIRARR